MRHVHTLVSLWAILGFVSDTRCQSPFSHWVEGTSANADGATRDDYNRGAGLNWTRFMGDWVDAQGNAHGSSAYHSASWIRDSQPGPEFVEMTELVREWVTGASPNQGVFLRGVSGSGTFRLHSREQQDPGKRPVLRVTLGAPAETRTLFPIADTYLTASTYRSQGDLDRLDLSTSNNVLLRFDSSAIPATRPILRADLELYAYAEYGTSLTVGVFRCKQGHAFATPVERGLAERYPEDIGIENDPDVYMSARFEDPGWRGGWTYGASSSNLATLSSDPARGFAPLSGDALRVKVARGSNYGVSMGYKFADETGSEPEEVWFRYYMRFANDWDPVSGGKLPGISGTYGRAGWGGRPSSGSNGWSARGLFKVAPPSGNPLANHAPIGSYVYHADMQGQYGDNEQWKLGYRGLLQRERWYCVEQHLKMNTPGQNDGVLKAWIDGRLAYERSDWRWRDISSLEIEQIWMNVYHGGSATAVDDHHLYIDNVVIARSHIGPLACVGSFQSFGAGCSGSVGTPTHHATGCPALGEVVNYELSGGPSHQVAALYLGASNTAWLASSLPLPLAFVGAPGCAVQSAPTFGFPTRTDAAGAASFAVRLPATPALAGLHVYSQYWIADPGANPLGLILTNGLDAQVLN